MFSRDQIVITVIVTLLALCIPFGVGMAVWTGNTNWLMLCGTLLIFLS